MNTNIFSLISNNSKNHGRIVLFLGQVFFVMSLVIIGCTRNDTNQIDLAKLHSVSVNPFNISQLRISDLIKDKHFVFFETRDSSLVSYVTKIVNYNEKYFLMSSANRGQIFVFTREGKFLKRFGRIGKGPGEFVSLRDFSINKETGDIYMLASTGKIIHTNSDLEWIEDLEVSGAPCMIDPYRIEIFQNKIYLRVFSMYHFSLLISDIHANFLNFYFYVNPSSTAAFRNFFSTKDTLWFFRELCDTIYYFSKSNIEPKPYFTVDFGKYSYVTPTTCRYEDYIKGQSESMPDESMDAAEIVDFALTNNICFCNYLLRKGGHSLSDNYSFIKYREQTAQNVTSDYFNDYFDSPCVFPLYVSSDQKHFISVVYPMDLIETTQKLIDSLGYEGYKSQFKILDSLSQFFNENSNPFIMLFSIN